MDAREAAPARHLVLLFVLAATLAAAGDAPRAEARAPYRGVRWESDLAAGLERAAREGRPIFFAINALDGERANEELATVHYRSAAWGEATAAYVCFVASPLDHSGADGLSRRFEGIPSRANQEAFTYIVKHHVAENVSPQHIVLEPDGTLAYRKAYYTGEVRPYLLDSYLSQLAPDLALAQANIRREEHIARFVALQPEARPAAAATWARDEDGLAAASLLLAFEGLTESNERLAVLGALALCRTSQAPVVERFALDWVLEPEREPAETSAFIAALAAIDRPRGVLAACRALARCANAATRDGLLGALHGPGGAAAALAKAPPPERALLWEALVFAGDERAGAPPAGAAHHLPPVRLQRAIARRAGRLDGLGGGRALSDALADVHAAGPLRAALLAASVEDLASHRDKVEDLATTSRAAQVRHGAALALLRLGATSRAVEATDVLVAAIDDAVEGPDVRAAAVAILGEDPGSNPEAWHAALRARLAPQEVPK